MSNIVKKAVIPVAGKGTRFLPVTKSVCKTMFPIINKPTIQYLVEECVDAGIEEIYIVINEYQKDIKDYFDTHSQYYQNLNKTLIDLEKLNHLIDTIKINYVVQQTPKGLGDAILCCEKYLKNEDFCVLLGDDLVLKDSDIYGIGDLIRKYQQNSAYYIGVKEVNLKDCSKYGIVKVDNNMKVLDMVEKPQNTPPSNLAGVGRYILRSNVFSYLKEITVDDIHEIMLTDAFIKACKKEDVIAYEFNGTRFDIGSHAGYVKAMIAFALEDTEINTEIYEYIKGIKNGIN